MCSTIRLRCRQTTDHNVWPFERSVGLTMLAELTWPNTSQAGGFPCVGVLCVSFIVC